MERIQKYNIGSLVPVLIWLMCCIAMTSCTSWDISDGTSNETQDSVNNGDGNLSDNEIYNLINENVSVQGKYSNYVWHFHIESTLHDVFPDSSVKFGIEHGDVKGTTYVSVEDEAYSYTFKMNNGTKIMDFENPCWFYYVFGYGSLQADSKDIWTESELYYESYQSLCRKGIGNLTTSELELYNSICKHFSSVEKVTDVNYCPSVCVYISKYNKYYTIKEFHR